MKTKEEIIQELNNWIETVNNFGSKKFNVISYDWIDWGNNEHSEFYKITGIEVNKMKWYPEDSPFKDCGSKPESDVLFKKINMFGGEFDLINQLQKYLSDDELKERLTEETYMANIEIPKFIKCLQIRKKIKNIEKYIQSEQTNIDFIKQAFEKFKTGEKYQPLIPKNECTLQESLDDRNARKLYFFDWDEFLTDENKQEL